MFDLDHVKRISPGWWGAVAGATAAGAALFPSSRIVAGAISGGAMFVVAVKLTPCCDGCKAGQGCGQREAIPLESPTRPARFVEVDVAKLFGDAATANGRPASASSSPSLKRGSVGGLDCGSCS